MKSIPEFVEEFRKHLKDIEELHRKGRIERRRIESAKMKIFFSFVEKVIGLKSEEYS